MLSRQPGFWQAKNYDVIYREKSFAQSMLCLSPSYTSKKSICKSMYKRPTSLVDSKGRCPPEYLH